MPLPVHEVLEISRSSQYLLLCRGSNNRLRENKREYRGSTRNRSVGHCVGHCAASRKMAADAADAAETLQRGRWHRKGPLGAGGGTNSHNRRRFCSHRFLSTSSHSLMLR